MEHWMEHWMEQIWSTERSTEWNTEWVIPILIRYFGGFHSILIYYLMLRWSSPYILFINRFPDKFFLK
jgi:hypothetical protein